MRNPSAKSTLDFDMGNYQGYIGQLRPTIIYQNQHGDRLIFQAFSRGTDVTVTKRPAPNRAELFGYAVSSREYRRNEALALLDKAIESGYWLSSNTPGEDA